jgi:hypothetical protein
METFQVMMQQQQQQQQEMETFQVTYDATTTNTNAAGTAK